MFLGKFSTTFYALRILVIETNLFPIHNIGLDSLELPFHLIEVE